ncbi:hypothetical protein [Vibrio pomeroyi]|uniref:hypothetical protein n=1 Tax=Vibrio pomeroyi TaxID=198832 RepID=UPI0021C3CD48|nr:hypothetical protein [Vibrio pomeroyi]
MKFKHLRNYLMMQVTAFAPFLIYPEGGIALMAVGVILAWGVMMKLKAWEA